MKHARKWLACLLAGALALAVLAGCSALMDGTVQKDTEQAKALMKEVDPSLTYNTDLEDAASRLADWLVEDSTQLTTQSGLLTRKVPMTTGSGAMLDKNVYDFIDHSTSFSVPAKRRGDRPCNEQRMGLYRLPVCSAAERGGQCTAQLCGRPHTDGRGVH